MAYTLTLDHPAKLVRYRHEGVIQRTELDAAWTDLMAMEEFTQRHYNIIGRIGSYKRGLHHQGLQHPRRRGAMAGKRGASLRRPAGAA